MGVEVGQATAPEQVPEVGAVEVEVVGAVEVVVG